MTSITYTPRIDAPGRFLFFFLFFIFLIFCLSIFSRASPTACGSSQARGLTRAVATSLHYSHSNARSITHCARPGIEPISPQRQCQILNLLCYSGNSHPATFITIPSLELYFFLTFFLHGFCTFVYCCFNYNENASSCTVCTVCIFFIKYISSETT